MVIVVVLDPRFRLPTNLKVIGQSGLHCSQAPKFMEHLCPGLRINDNRVDNLLLFKQKLNKRAFISESADALMLDPYLMAPGYLSDQCIAGLHFCRSCKHEARLRGSRQAAVRPAKFQNSKELTGP